DWFDAAVEAGGDRLIRPIANWMQGELLRELKRDGRRRGECPIAPAHLAELCDLIERGVISGKIGKDVVATVYVDGRARGVLVAEAGLEQLSDAGAIEAMAADLVAAHPVQAEGYRRGNAKLLGFFVGQVMKASGGKANPALVNQVLKKVL